MLRHRERRQPAPILDVSPRTLADEELDDCRVLVCRGDMQRRVAHVPADERSRVADVIGGERTACSVDVLTAAELHRKLHRFEDLGFGEQPLALEVGRVVALRPAFANLHKRDEREHTGEDAHRRHRRRRAVLHWRLRVGTRRHQHAHGVHLIQRGGQQIRCRTKEVFRQLVVTQVPVWIGLPFRQPDIHVRFLGNQCLHDIRFLRATAK